LFLVSILLKLRKFISLDVKNFAFNLSPCRICICESEIKGNHG